MVCALSATIFPGTSRVAAMRVSIEVHLWNSEFLQIFSDATVNQRVNQVHYCVLKSDLKENSRPELGKAGPHAADRPSARAVNQLADGILTLNRRGVSPSEICARTKN
jgi:hypothetical protein